MMKFLLMIFLLTFSALSFGAGAVSEKMSLKATEVAKLTEDQIPLSISTENKAVSSESSSMKAIFSMMIVMALIGVSYYYVRRYRTSNTINASNMKIKVLTQHYLGPKKSLAIVHVAGESILIGVTDSNISMIKSLSLIDDEVPAEMPKTFNESLEVSEGAMEGSTPKMVDELDEEFSFAGVTDTVSKKIKSMRRFS